MTDDDSRRPIQRDAEAPDEEITEAMLEAGKEPKESAERLRAVLLDVTRRYRERKGR